jgi:hypothetical protein
MLPDSVIKIIEEQERNPIGREVSEDEAKALMRKQGLNEEYIKKTFIKPEVKLKELGIEEGTTFYEFYTNLGFIPIGQGEEIHTLDDIIDEKESQFHEEDYPGIYDRFLQISSIEGEGSYFYEIATEIVYDTNWGEEEAMMLGTLENNWPNFYSFLEWYYSPEGKNV